MLRALTIWTILFLAIAIAACSAEKKCDQGAVDNCYAEQGCTESSTCILNSEGVNNLCICLDDRNCDQPWYHELCDDAPYDAGTCPVCGEE